MAGRNADDSHIPPPDVFGPAGGGHRDRVSGGKEEGEDDTLAEYEAEQKKAKSWGVISHGVADHFYATDSVTGRRFTAPYPMLGDWLDREEKPRPNVARLGIVFWGEPAWLTITVHPGQVQFLDLLLMAIQHRHLKSLRADGEKILSVSVELSPQSYHPFAD